MRGLPFFKTKNKPQFAGLNFSDVSSGGDTSDLVNKSDITAIILTGTTNTSGGTITAGTWFYLNGTPCIAKVDIASGATFTLNTNYEEKTIGSALTELNSNSVKYVDVGKSGTITFGSGDMLIYDEVIPELVGHTYLGAIVQYITNCSKIFSLVSCSKMGSNTVRFFLKGTENETITDITFRVFYQ